MGFTVEGQLQVRSVSLHETLLLLLARLLLVLRSLLAAEKANSLISDQALMGGMNVNCLPVIKACSKKRQDII